MPRLRKNWELDRRRLEILLRALHEDPEVAAQRYPELHVRLETYFRFNSGEDPSLLADIVIERLAAKLEEDLASAGGAKIPADKVHAYAFGIARTVKQEHWRARVVPQIQPARPSERHLDHDCLERALASIPSSDLETLESYYATENEVAAHRVALAGRLGLTPDNLRQRVRRSALAVLAFYRQCLERKIF